MYLETGDVARRQRPLLRVLSFRPRAQRDFGDGAESPAQDGHPFQTGPKNAGGELSLRSMVYANELCDENVKVNDARFSEIGMGRRCSKGRERGLESFTPGPLLS